MKKLWFLALTYFLVSGTLQAQEEDIVSIIDDLTVKWDTKAEKLKAYDGLRHLCKERSDRQQTIQLLKDIHHYDSVLYKIVSTKYAGDKDHEAKKTLDDIEELESEYTTGAFLKFIHKECNRFNEIENNFARKGGSVYEKEIQSLEKEMSKYVKAITKQIDVIDNHIHHLKKLN